MKRVFPAAAAVLLLSTPVHAMPGAYYGTPTPQARPAQLQPDMLEAERRNQKIRGKLIRLREEGLKLQDADGGTLTAEHRAYLQKKLDELRTGASEPE